MGVVQGGNFWKNMIAKLMIHTEKINQHFWVDVFFEHEYMFPIVKYTDEVTWSGNALQQQNLASSQSYNQPSTLPCIRVEENVRLPLK